MKRVGWVVMVVAALLAGMLPGGAARPAAAQEPNAWTSYVLNMRTGPGPDHAVVTQLPSNTPLVLEARNDDVTWFLGRTADGVYRGWLSALYLSYAAGFVGAHLPVSAEVVASAPAAPPAAPPAEQAAPAAPAGSLPAHSNNTLNMRGGPGTSFRVVGSVSPGAALALERATPRAPGVLGSEYRDRRARLDVGGAAGHRGQREQPAGQHRDDHGGRRGDRAAVAQLRHV